MDGKVCEVCANWRHDFRFSEKGSCRLHSINVKIESGKLVKRYPRTMARDTCGSYKAMGEGEEAGNEQGQE